MDFHNFRSLPRILQLHQYYWVNPTNNNRNHRTKPK